LQTKPLYSSVLTMLDIFALEPCLVYLDDGKEKGRKKKGGKERKGWGKKTQNGSVPNWLVATTLDPPAREGLACRVWDSLLSTVGYAGVRSIVPQHSVFSSG